MTDTSSATGSATVGTGPRTGMLDPAPGTTDAQHREAEEMERPQANDPGQPPPPPPLPPSPPREQGDFGSEESGELSGNLPSGEETGEIDRRTQLAHEVSKVVGNQSDIEKLSEMFGMKPPESVQSAFAQARHHLLPELQAFQVALEDEDDPVRLTQLMDAYECFQKAFEYGVGMKHYPRFTTAVRILDFDRIILYTKVLQTLIAFQKD